MANPKRILEKIGGLIDLDFAEIANALSACEVMKVGHTIAGNRLRMAGSVQIHMDTEWTDKMILKDRQIFWLLAGWQMRKYRYKKTIT